MPKEEGWEDKKNQNHPKNMPYHIKLVYLLLYPTYNFYDPYLLGYHLHPAEVLLVWKTWNFIHLLVVLPPYPYMCLQATLV